MPNISGPIYLKRHLLTSVVNSKMFYAASILANTALDTAKKRKVIYRTQRLAAFRIIRGYRTMSYDVALFLARILPGDLLIQESQRVRRRKSDPGSSDSVRKIRNEERNTMIEKWKDKWQRSTKGSWTRKVRLPSNLQKRSHGWFRQYLFRMHRASDATYLFCAHPRDSAEQTLFDCPRWDNERLSVGRFLGGRSLLVQKTSKIFYAGRDLLDSKTRSGSSHCLQQPKEQ